MPTQNAAYLELDLHKESEIMKCWKIELDI